jgi:NADH-quinone oxidoreductase subunit L
MTHAFFKACLFLGAGSVIHGVGGEQDMRKMGGLRKTMPKTHWTMLVATLAIAGIPLFAGFYSKDEILAGAYAFSPMIWIIGAFGAGLTAFYMFRLYYMTFWGEYRGAKVEGIETSEPEHGGHNLIPDQRHLDEGDEHTDKGHGHHVHAHEPHESPRSMTGVLAILAVLSIIGGWVGWPAALGGGFPTPFQRWLEPVLLPLGGHQFHFHEASMAFEILLMAVSVGIAGFGIWQATRFYLLDPTWSIPKRLGESLAPVHRVLTNKYYVDELYNATVIRGTILFATFLALFDVYVIDGAVNLVRHATVFVFGHGSRLFDTYVVDGAVNGVASTAKGGSTLFRRMQSGVVQNYAMIMGAGIVLIAVVYLFTKA